MAKLKLPFELEKPSSNEYVTQASEVGYKGRSAEEALDEALDHMSNPEIESNTFYVTDSNGYVIAKIDKDGVHSVDFKVGVNDTSLSEALGNVTGQITQAVNAEKQLREQGDVSLAESLAVEENRAKSEEAKKLNAIINDNAFYFTDANGYIVAKIDANGIHSVNIDENPNVINDKEIIVTDSNGYIILRIDSTGIHSININESEEGNQINDNKIIITDADGYIIAKIDANGVHSVNIDENSNVISDDKIVITDNNGYIVARIDSSGLHSVQDKHSVACMVIGENYYPTATPTKDSNGNVTHVAVMFSTGVAGEIDITYANGLSSSVAVLYGNITYTITINRDSEGNVTTVSVN